MLQLDLAKLIDRLVGESRQLYQPALLSSTAEMSLSHLYPSTSSELVDIRWRLVSYVAYAAVRLKGGAMGHLLSSWRKTS